MTAHFLVPLLLAAAPVPAPADTLDFPTDALMPKRETRADVFLERHPEYDGRGVVVAILDTGVDPGAAGLQVTSDGRPKIVDIVDASGSGDIDTSTRRTTEDGVVEGLSGRSLRPDPAWVNPTGEWRVGQKPAWELFPSGLIRRAKSDRDRSFDETQRSARAAAALALADWDAAHPSPTRKELEERGELAARVEMLDALADGDDDPGPVYDCLVFHDGETWRAALDTDEDGDFADEKAMTNFRDERQWSTFGDRDLLNYALNIYEEGDRLSVVVDTGSHGTHVAGIVAAHYPDRPELNGIAPGAQIVSVKIGDTRLGASSIGTGDVRGFVTTLADGCDLVNMSYGGPRRIPEGGRIERLRAELVNDHGVVFVATAGNNGPALTSLGGPGGTSTAPLGIGAVVSPEMMAQQYHVRDPYAELPYHWSSRGPAADGYLGVDFCAPGGAIAPVTNWSLRGNAQMNGTSMAAPSVCGGLALLVSGLKAEGIPYSPQTLRRALANTARPLDDVEPWAQGTGVIRIDDAWAHLKRHADRADRDVRYEISVAARDDARGILLREPFENDRPFEETVTVTPGLPKDADNRIKVAFERRINLRATAPWVDVAGSVLLMWGGRGFPVRVDPTGLPPGAHFAEVVGRDAADPQAGPLFRVPITVIRTLAPESDDGTAHRERLRLRPGRVERRFLAVPEAATWADIRIRRLDRGTDRTVVLHTVQLLDQQAFSDHGSRTYLRLSEGEEAVRSLALVGGRTLEVALVQSWSSPGETEVALDVEFHGIVPSPSAVSLDTASGAVPVDMQVMLRPESVQPSGELDVLRRTVAPRAADIRPLSADRDSLWDGRLVHELVRSYDVKIGEKGAYAFNPSVHFLPDVAMDIESSLWILEDKQGRRVAVDAGTGDDAVDLEKGDYVLYLHNRHDDPETLEKLGGTSLYVDRQLSKPVRVSFTYDSGGDRAARAREMRAGERVRMWARAPEADALPKGAEPGDRLRGTFSLGREQEERLGEGRRPDGWPIEVAVTPKADVEKKEPEPEDEDPRSVSQQVAEAVRDLKVERLGKLGPEDGKAFDSLSREILKEWPGHLPVLVARLERVDADHGRGDTRRIVQAADAVLAAVDRDDLARHFGREVDETDPAAVRERKERGKERDALRTALRHKARALAVAARESGDGASRQAMEQAWKDLAAWDDPDSAESREVRILRERAHGRPASALALVREALDDAPDDERELRETKLELLQELGWDHWAERARNDLAVRFPSAPRVF